MNIQYDAQVDILTVSLGTLAASAGAREIAPGVWLDLDQDGTPLGLEILDASKRPPYDTAVLAVFPPRYGELMPLADAADVAGSTVAGLRKAIQRGRLQGQKMGGAWFTTIADLTAYINDRAASGRRPAGQMDEGKAIAQATAAATTRRSL